MSEMQPEDLRRILTELKYQPPTMLGDQGDYEYVPVWRLVPFASRVCELGDDGEEKVDAVVERIGGHRRAVTDPWRVVPDIVRRIRGKPLRPRDDFYEIPKSFWFRPGT